MTLSTLTYLPLENFVWNFFFVDSNVFTDLIPLVNWYDWQQLTDLYWFPLVPNTLNSDNELLPFVTDLNLLPSFNNTENIASLYHYSIPTTKLAYPEPFIASASFMHSDLWFVHILTYQYWLWFVFTFIIIFFFITFVCTVRWCNMRVRPRRETRGVSRSKCGDLITACVPVSWAASIIVNESTDAIDYYDGFGTTELVIGIRAYQWGWEYYYPKDLDLNYNIKKNYSSFIGNSLKYNNTTDLTLKNNNLWKFYQNKPTDQVLTPAHLILFPNDKYQILNFNSYNDVGINTLYEINAFKKTRLFSKSHSENLFSTFDKFNIQFNNFNKLFTTSNSYFDSLSYGIKRQHNFVASQSATITTTPFNKNSSLQLLEYNLNYQPSSVLNFHNQNKYFLDVLNYKVLNQIFEIYFSLFMQNSQNSYFNKFFTFEDNNVLFNNDTDKKWPKHVLINQLNFVYLKNIFNNTNFCNNLQLNFFFNGIPSNEVYNSSKIKKNYNIFSNSQNVLTNAKYIRKYLFISPHSSSLNFNIALNSNIQHFNSFYTNNNAHVFLFNTSKSNWFNLETIIKLGTNKNYMDAPHSPITTNHPHFSWFDYDNLNNSFVDEIPVSLQGKEDTLPDALTALYWNFFWGHVPLTHRINNNLSFMSNLGMFYLPLFVNYYDYDFRNLQSIELFEDSFWETAMPSLIYDEYKNTWDEFYKSLISKKLTTYFNVLNREFIFKDKILSNYANLELNLNLFISSLPIYLDDLINNPGTISTTNFFVVPFSNLLNGIDETYEISKQHKTIFYKSNQLLLDVSNFVTPTLASSFIFDFFRSDYEDFSWFINKFNFNFLKSLNLLSDVPYESFNTNNTRFSNFLQLRNTVKSSMVNHNALQKVFRARFDEGRSNSKIEDLGMLFSKQPYLTSNRPHYEKLLGKTHENFFSTIFYKNIFLKNFNLQYLLNTSLNYYFFDFPFLLAHKSDASRYLWFDWFSKWGFYEVQPASASKYAIFGMPYYNKYFEFNPVQNELLTETETYFLRLARARRNYLSNWTYTPFLFTKNHIWNPTNISSLYENFSLLEQLKHTLAQSSQYWIYINTSTRYHFIPSISNINSFAKSTWQPTTSIASYYYTLSLLSDILTKREFMYREFFYLNNLTINIPVELTNTPNHYLINEIKSLFEFSDPINYMNESSKSIYFSSLNFFNYNTLKIFLSTHSLLNLHDMSNLIYKFIFADSTRSSIDPILLKNQYRPLRKGINNMLRLHATGAVAMPIEIRLQILASSKDVIHSWAVPSAGIKIDCVPGYSSHKVMIFLVSGIFWGQCMEICGRYHHWMPIVVYFMKRDLFFLWCTHFVFLSGANNLWTINDRQFTDYLRPVSFNKSAWINEIIK